MKLAAQIVVLLAATFAGCGHDARSAPDASTAEESKGPPGSGRKPDETQDETVELGDMDLGIVDPPMETECFAYEYLSDDASFPRFPGAGMGGAGGMPNDFECPTSLELEWQSFGEKCTLQPVEDQPLIPEVDGSKCCYRVRTVCGV